LGNVEFLGSRTQALSFYSQIKQFELVEVHRK
jgi:hypothetical protein